jgi:hypothetical protein
MSGLAPVPVIPSASEGPRLNSWITQANLGFNTVFVSPHPESIRVRDDTRHVAIESAPPI